MKKPENKSWHKVPANIRGMNGIRTFVTSFVDEKSLMNKKTARPIKEASRAENIKPGNPDIKPQKIL